MYVACVTIWVKPENAVDFLAASLENACQTRREAGNLRFDVLRGADDSNRFCFYEVYRDEEAFRAHQQTAHYFQWRDTVANWMAQPRQGLKYQSIFPEGEAAWSAAG
jgi:(4S)-4-hydroxy-5-phosphonooxypentane-2,3-dione isomerase